jgi:hypothetical protein
VGDSFEIASFQITENTLQAPKLPATSRGANINFIPRCANPAWAIPSKTIRSKALNLMSGWNLF